MAESTTIDEELYDGLQQARKKKPRNFCLVAKGADVVKLIVQKKKINEGQAQKAKSEAKGNLVITGVVVGEGMELSFEITGSEPSITAKKIKDYISDNTDLTLKPKWTVVTQLREVKEDDDAAMPQAPPKAPGGQPAAPSGPAAQQPPVPPPAPGDRAEIPEPPTPPAPPSGRADIPQPPTASPSSDRADAAPEAPPPQPADVLGELVAKMNKLVPLIQAAAQANPDRKPELLKPVAAFQASVKAKDAAAATESLKATAALLKQVGTTSPAPPTQPPVSPPPPQSKPADVKQPEVAAQEQREGEGQEKSPADVQADQFNKDWAAARKNLRLAIDKVEGQLATLADALLKSNDPNMQWVAENGLTLVLGGLRASATAIDKKSSKAPAKTAAFVKPMLAELEKQLDSDRVKACDQNQFGVKVSVKKTISDAIEELAKTLETAVV